MRRINEAVENEKDMLWNAMSEFLNLAGQGNWNDWDAVAKGSDPQAAVSSIIDDDHKLMEVHPELWEITGGGHDPISVDFIDSSDKGWGPCDWNMDDHSNYSGELYVDINHPKYSVRKVLVDLADLMSAIIIEMENENMMGGYGSEMVKHMKSSKTKKNRALTREHGQDHVKECKPL